MADEHDFKAGERLRVKAALYRQRQGDFQQMISRGQIMEVTEEDVSRSDAALIWERPEPEELAAMDSAEEPDSAVSPDEATVDFTRPDYDALRGLLAQMNLRDAKTFLSRDEWDQDGLSVAREAEVAGKNRDKLLSYIDGRIAQMDDADAQEGPA